MRLRWTPEDKEIAGTLGGCLGCLVSLAAVAVLVGLAAGAVSYLVRAGWSVFS